jgi:hypothetical protein
MAELLESPQSYVSGETFASRLCGERLNGAFNLLLQYQQAIVPVIYANPNDPRGAGVGEEADAGGAQMQGGFAGTNGLKRLLQGRHTTGRNITEKPEREMKLFRLCPADRAARGQRLQFALKA